MHSRKWAVHSTCFRNLVALPILSLVLMVIERYTSLWYDILDWTCSGSVNTSIHSKSREGLLLGLLPSGGKMADAQGGPSPPPSSWSSTLSIVDDDTEVQHCTNPEAGEEFSNEKEQEGEEEKQKDEDENEEEEQEEEDEDEDEDEDKDEDEDEEVDNAFQVSHYQRMGYSRQEELRKILRALRGEPDENQNRRCTRCTTMGHVCLDCPLPIRFIPWRQEYVPQQNPTQPNQAHSLRQGQATNPSEAGCSGSSSQEVNPETKVPSVSSASASQLRKRKSDSGSEMGTSTKKP